MDLILYNPKSKNSRANIQTHKLLKKYKTNKIPFRLKSILKIRDITTYLDSHPEYDNVILLGGDGTINKLVNKIVDYDLKQDIYIKKNGSGNDFLRTLKKQDSSPLYIMENTLDDTRKHYFINGTGYGLDGLIIDYVDKAKNKGKLSYMISSFRAMFHFVPEPLDAVIDGKEYHFEKAYLVVINNGRFVGGGMQITPQANINDEMLDVIIVHGISKMMISILFLTIYLGIHTKFTKWVFSKKCKEITVKYTTPQICQSDGERYDDVMKMHVKSSHKKVHLRAYDK